MSSNHSSSSPSPNSITTVYYLNQQQQRAPSSHNVNFRQPTIVNLHNPSVDSSQQMYHYRIEDSTSSQSPQQLKERAQSPLIVAVPNQRQQQRASSVLSGKSSPALSQVSQQDQSSTSPTEQEILKCAHFFKSLLKMRPQQQQIINILDLKNLLREVLLGEQTPEEFTVKLREVTKSQDKGNLLPFLKRALPALRRSIQNGEYFELRQALDLDDYSPKSSLPTPPPNESQQNVLPSSPMMPNAPAAQQQIVFIEQQSKIIQQQKVVSADCLEQKITTTTTTVVEEQTAHSQIKQECSNASSILHFQQAAEPKTPTALAIESETGPNLAPNTIPNNIINLPQMLLNPQALADRILAHMPSAEGVDPEVLAIISNATEARLRTILTHLSMLAEHRMEQLRIDPHYRMIDEPRKQLRFMEDIEKRAHDNRQNAEKEALLKITKSKGKDKDTLEKAKQLQKADREATVNREANAAAFAALGRIGTKRPFTANAGTADWKSGLQTQGLGNGLTGPARPSRIKRVTIRDLQFFLSVSAASPSNAKLRHRLALSGLNIDENTSI